MNTRNTQKGLTMWGIMMIILIAVFFLFLFFKLFPAYMQDFEIGSQLESISKEPNARNMSQDDIMSAIRKRWEIEDISNVSSDQAKIVPEGNHMAINLNYEVEIPMLGNVSVLLDFKHHVSVR